jgi:hypothetical protein
MSAGRGPWLNNWENEEVQCTNIMPVNQDIIAKELCRSDSQIILIMPHI